MTGNDYSEILSRGVTNTIPAPEKLKTLLQKGKKLNVYLGIDPTATKIHLGNAVPLRKLQKFVELGHNVTFLIGDFTALIGDTSDKESERPVLSYEEIQENFKTYKDQASKLLDFSKVKVRFNSEWLQKLDFKETIKLCQHFSFGDFAGRELIKKRLENSKHVGLHEALYPVMQGYDSYFLDTDIQMGGADQTFNMQAGRILQKELRNKESYVLVTGYLEGTDGRKMSKSWGNAIWLTDTPNDMYGKVMSLKDDLILTYFYLATNTPEDDVKAIEKRIALGENPMNLKKELAKIIVNELHNEQDAISAQKYFENTVQNKVSKSDDLNIPVLNLPKTLVSLPTISVLTQTGHVSSNSELKRLVSQNAIEVNGNVVKSLTHPLKSGELVRIGKKMIVKMP